MYALTGHNYRRKGPWGMMTDTERIWHYLSEPTVTRVCDVGAIPLASYRAGKNDASVPNAITDAPYRYPTPGDPFVYNI